MIKPELQAFRGEILERRIFLLLSYQRMMSTWSTANDTYFDHLNKMVSVQFLHCKIIIFCFHTLFFGNTLLHLAHAHSVEEWLNLYLEEGGTTYIYYLERLRMEDLSLLFSINCISHMSLLCTDFCISTIKRPACSTTVSQLGYFAVFINLYTVISVKLSIPSHYEVYKQLFGLTSTNLSSHNVLYDSHLFLSSSYVGFPWVHLLIIFPLANSYTCWPITWNTSPITCHLEIFFLLMAGNPFLIFLTQKILALIFLLCSIWCHCNGRLLLWQ